MAAIACGVLAALAVHRYRSMPRSTVRWLRALGVIALLAAGPFDLALWRGVHNGFLLVVAAASAVLCATSAWQMALEDDDSGTAWARFSRMLRVGAAPVRSFCRLSYEIYLTHIFVMWRVVDLFNALGSPPLAVQPAHLLSLGIVWAAGWIPEKAWSLPAGRWVVSAAARRVPTAPGTVSAESAQRPSC